MQKKIKTVIFGSREVSKICLDILMSEFPEILIVAYVLHDNTPNLEDEAWIVDVVEKKKIPIVSRSEVAGLGFDFALSLAYDRLIAPEIISIAKLGIINIDLGPLPRFGGHNSLYHAIRESYASEDCKFGFSTHYIDDNLDEGQIINVSEVSITGEDTAYSLYKKTLPTLPELFVETLKACLESYPYKIQEVINGSEGARYYKKNDIQLEIDLSQAPEAIYNHIRALSFPGKPPGHALVASKKVYLSL